MQDYAALGLTLGRHPLALLRAQLRAEGLRDTRDLQAWKSGRLLRLAGLVLMRQRPGSAKGVIFITIEDEHGTANLVVYTDIAARDRRALRGAMPPGPRVGRGARRAICRFSRCGMAWVRLWLMKRPSCLKPRRCCR